MGGAFAVWIVIATWIYKTP